ncbi:MAG: ketopantoate reductase family protein [Myxococcota bacterium]
MAPAEEYGIIGAGAVGLAVASHLHRAGVGVRLVARPAAAEALRRDGIHRSGAFGAHHVPPDEISIDEHPTAWWGRPLTAILVCAKTFASQEIAEDLAPTWESLSALAPVVLFQNGWGTAEIFARSLPARRVFNARIITGFRKRGDTGSEVTVHADALKIGSLHGADPEELAPLAAALTRGGFPTETTAEIGRDLWAKLLYNCALNPLGALRGATYGELAECEDARAIMRGVVFEVFAAMRAEGWQTWWRRPGDFLADFYDRIIPPTASHESSMLQDLRAGRRTEIEFLSGAIVRIGVRRGVETPVNTALRDLVLAIEERRLGRSGDGL